MSLLCHLLVPFLSGQMNKIQPHVSPSEMPVPEVSKGSTQQKPTIRTISSKIQILENAINSSFRVLEKSQTASENLCSEYLQLVNKVQYLAFD